MSLDDILGGAQSTSNNVAQGIATIGRLGADLGLASAARAPTWRDRLRPASFRGIPFGVLDSEGQFGRRNAIHEYPFRDSVWVEDLGRAARKIQFTGFLVGDDIIEQRERLIAACESVADFAELLHPTLGKLTVSLLGAVAITERWDKGRYFELKFSFIEAGQRVFPTTQSSTSDAITSLADAADAATLSSFTSRAAVALKQGAAVVQQAVNTTNNWTMQVQKVANDATNLYNMVGTLKGSFGRFFGGRTVSGIGGATSQRSTGNNSVSGLIALGSAARAKVSAAANVISCAAARLGQ